MNNTTYNTTARIGALLLFLVFACTGAWAQVTGDQYSTYSGASSTTSITHKTPKWTQYHETSYNDTYNTADMVTLENGATVQAANAYVDTIYMHKGTSTTLTLPYRVSNNNASIYNYLRWFDYRTDGNFNCNWTPTGSSEVYDLLTPAIANTSTTTRTVYRFANGYVVQGAAQGSAMTSMDFYYPTDDEYTAINSTNFIKSDNDYYIVACDASIYTDFKADNDGTAATFGSANSWCEPTLSGRAIYYIIGVEDNEEHRPGAFTNYWKLLQEDFQGGTNTGDEHYIDEYEITYPSRRLSNNTAEMVALTKDANAYAIPGTNSDDDPGELDVTLIADESLGFNLTFTETGNTTPTNSGTSGKISGNDRIIFFYKGTLGGLYSSTSNQCVPTDTQWYVDDGSSITILVTKTVTTNGVATTYNLARYKITFKDDANLLTQTQVNGLKNLTGNEGYWWNNLTHRSPDYIESRYNQVASLTFDYDTNVNGNTVLPNGQKQFYPFPMDWTSNGYAFYDGVTSADANTTFDTNTGADASAINVGTRFSMYSITNEYIGYWDRPSRTAARPPANTGKDDSGYWLYIDASERPGAVAEITIDGDLCPGSKLYGTAWIKGAGGASSVDAGALFSLGGVTIEDDGTETHLPILRQATGQVRATTRITEDNVNEPNLSSDVTGKGANTNEWFQVYFSFVSSGVSYDYYTLRVDNYCAGTDGGDYYFDELKVYVETPTVEMVQLDPICATSDDDKSAMRLDLDYEVMMSRLGFEPSDYSEETKDDATTASVDFVIINEAQYYNALAVYEGDTDTDEYKTYQEEAFRAALVTFYDVSGNGHEFPTLNFYCNYELNEDYDEADSPIIDFTDGDEGYFYRRYNETIQELSVECLTNMLAYTEYIILLEPHTETDKTDVKKLEEFIALMEDQCAIKAEFYLSSTTILKLNGETVDPTADYCAGQEFVISPEVTYTEPDTGETIYIDGVYFDWFFGSRDEYVAANETYGGVSLQEALIMFRTYYPDAEELSETETPPTGENASQDFTQDHYDIIAYYLNAVRSGGMNNMLVLHKSHLDMRVLDTGLELVIQPIEMTFEEENVEICFGYVPLTLYASGDAPTLKAGFHNIDSPDGYDPCLRLGLAQLEKCDEETPFTINLCKATYVTEADENGETIVIDHLGVADGMDMLFLVDTDDPAYRETILGKENEIEEIVVGKIARLYATTTNANDPRVDAPTEVKDIGSYMQIYFYGEDEKENDPSITPFTVREGYYYVVSVYFQEKGSFDDGEQAVGNACWGTFPLEIKVVPEYLVWTGDKTANWNNDNHWRRADKEELNKAETDTYPTNEANGTDNGFVPMLFSKVIIPKNSAAELYMAGFIEEEEPAGETVMLTWEGDEDTANHDDVSEHPTSNIMYDLMLYENKSEHYRVNLCDQIHFEPMAQLLHSEQLIYNKAWTEVELPQGPWLLTATPLQDVVSGDWYTKISGRETAEYFTDITWDDDYNYRYTPLVYQRSWGTSDKVIINNYTGTTGATTDVPSYASTGWSSVYNDTSVPYQSGEGFSIKANLNSGTDNLMFRFPKADTSYDLSTSSLTRANAGRLLISNLVTRTVDAPDNDDEDDIYTGTVSVDLTQTGNDYYIIGNPYTAHMSMSEFMKANEQFVGYWTESTYGPVAGNGTYSSWGTEDCLIEPYGAFFVTTEESDVTPLLRGGGVATFTKDMQVEEDEGGDDDTSSTKLVALSIRATGEGGTSSASVAYAENATDNFSASEDAMLMEDASWTRDGMPLVYSVAGDKAVSVNTLKQLTLIPIGAFADEGSMYTLRFVGVDNLDEPALVDTYEDTETPLTEGFTLEVDGPTHGRYFIRVNTPIMTDIEETESPVLEVSAYSPVQRTVVVSSDAGLENVEIYSVGGMLLKRENVGGSVSCTIDGVASGIAIVKVKTTEGTTVKKIRVR